MPLPVRDKDRLPALEHLPGNSLAHAQVGNLVLVYLVIREGGQAVSRIYVAVGDALVERNLFLYVVEKARVDRVQVLMLLKDEGVFCYPQEILLPLFRAASLDDAQLDSAAAFASTATCYLDGNIQSACDWALVLWLIPRLRDAGTRSRMRELLVSSPNACKMLG